MWQRLVAQKIVRRANAEFGRIQYHEDLGGECLRCRFASLAGNQRGHLFALFAQLALEALQHGDALFHWQRLPGGLRLPGAPHRVMYRSRRGTSQFGQFLSSCRIRADDRLSARDLRDCAHNLPYSTLTRYRPQAGAVAPAALRFLAARMVETSSGFRAPLPICRKVPTRLRTMWCRNPLPRMV